LSADNESSRKRLARIRGLGPAWITAIAGLVVALTSAGFFAGRITAPPTTDAISSLATVASLTEISSMSPNGAELGSYDINLPIGYSVPLGPTHPTQSQFTNGSGGDIWTNSILEIGPGNGNKMLNLPDGTTPTYQQCADDTLFENQVSAKPGVAFCLVEAGKMVGVTVTSVSSTQPYYAALHVTVWQNS
jgi:hypothetical protein